jgi:hypothetical protein
MTVELRVETGWDFVRDTLADEDQARSIYAILNAQVKGKTEMKSLHASMAASDDTTFDIAEVPAYDTVFVFVEKASTLYLKTADPLALPDAGWLMAEVTDLDHLRIVNGGTAGSVVWVIAG